MEKFRGDTKFKRNELFTFQKAGIERDGGITPIDHCEFLVIYKGNHVETFSIDRISVEKLERKLEEIENVNPKSMRE